MVLQGQWLQFSIAWSTSKLTVRREWVGKYLCYIAYFPSQVQRNISFPLLWKLELKSDYSSVKWPYRTDLYCEYIKHNKIIRFKLFEQNSLDSIQIFCWWYQKSMLNHNIWVNHITCVCKHIKSLSKLLNDAINCEWKFYTSNK